jgi:hypothetical protein
MEQMFKPQVDWDPEEMMTVMRTTVLPRDLACRRRFRNLAARETDQQSSSQAQQLMDPVRARLGLKGTIEATRGYLLREARDHE